jgi:formate dehydrogenase subunit gamma
MAKLRRTARGASVRRRKRFALGSFFFIVLLAVCLPLIGYLFSQPMAVGAEKTTENANPHANFWRAVRDGVSGYSAVEGQERGVLIQNGGQNWREIRNGLVASISPWVLAVVFFVIGLFFIVKGQDKLEARPSGERIRRWALGERVLHWVTATLFVLLAVTGFSMLFGRRVLIPVFGLYGFGGYAQVAKTIHNYTGPFFFAGILLEIIAWVRYNIPKKMDFVWFKNLGGMVGSGPRPHAERINGGEKAWFWVMATIGAAVCIAGLVMDFPNFGQTRLTMQIANIIHASLATLFLAGSFGHIYIGTIGAEGTFEGMWKGHVSAEWAKQHQDLWYEEKVGEKLAATTGEDG